MAHADTYGHLRGKRLPLSRFLGSGCKNISIADAVFIMDLHCDLVDNPYVNMDSGFLDTVLVSDLSTARLLPHRPGYALVFTDAYDEHGEPHALSPRTILATQVERCRAAGVDPLVATELEFYLFTPDWKPIQDYIQYSSLTDSTELEGMIAEMRHTLGGAGMVLESSNAEYGPSQWEINAGPANAMRTADNTVLLKSIIKQIARNYDLRASFMPKPFEAESGSGTHIHASLIENGNNAFASSDGHPNETMAKWTAGILEHSRSMALFGSPTPNGFKRVRPYTFAPTHIHWGLDNRTVMARCITEKGSEANRVEFRALGSDSNPYLTIAMILAAGLDGLERSLELPEKSVGDMYAEPGDCGELCCTMSDGIEAFEGSPLADCRTPGSLVM